MSGQVGRGGELRRRHQIKRHVLAAPLGRVLLHGRGVGVSDGSGQGEEREADAVGDVGCDLGVLLEVCAGLQAHEVERAEPAALLHCTMDVGDGSAVRGTARGRERRAR